MPSKIVGTWAAFLISVTIFSNAIGEKKTASSQSDPLCNATCMTMRAIALQKSVVRIDLPGVRQGTGTIVLHESVAYILTSNHVVEKAEGGRVEVTFENGEKTEVEILGRDPAIDLAILWAPALPRGVSPAKLGEGLAVGQQVYAVGYPFGERSVTFGYINAIDTSMWPFAWTQTPLDPGNSGGPLFNEKMEVVAVNTAVLVRKSSTSGVVSLVIPIDYVKRLLPRLLRERVVRYGAAGISFMDSARATLAFLKKHGIRYSSALREVVVEAVEAGSPAERADIQEGDVILEWNETAVTSARKLKEQIFFDHSPGDEVTITIRRGEQTFKRILRLREYTPPPAQQDLESHS